jgi:hypothetical protein
MHRVAKTIAMAENNRPKPNQSLSKSQSQSPKKYADTEKG